MAGKPSGRSTARFRTVPREDLVAATLVQLAADEDQLLALLGETGLDPAALRSGLADDSVQAGLLGFLVHNEALIIAVAHDLQRTPEEIAASALHLTGHADYF